ncbi:MAG: helix-turn-helix domain-containing protein [Pseudomonadota bacterium]
MKTKSFSDMQCSIARSLELVGSWWSLLIIRDAMMGARRFKHFQKSLGIAKNTLTSRLNQLIDSDILERVPAKDGSAYDEYQLTPKGRDLGPIILALSQWGDKWAVHPDGPSFEYFDRKTGEDLTAIWPRRANGEAMELRDVGVKPAGTSTPQPESGIERTSS